MGKSIIDLLGSLRGVEGSIVATMEGWKGPFWICTIVEESTLWLN